MQLFITYLFILISNNPNDGKYLKFHKYSLYIKYKAYHRHPSPPHRLQAQAVTKQVGI